ncbi:unnamed protein product [Cladocopium goreaui]|uniref:Uncharacterized protein n=1 Tax=Cladocopium goreaui TaxID=2562237 RepID=A0A9P1FX81_9DINO|nr:unnamed protein product [Cladocopium goreaui]
MTVLCKSATKAPAIQLSEHAKAILEDDARLGIKRQDPVLERMAKGYPWLKPTDLVKALHQWGRLDIILPEKDLESSEAALRIYWSRFRSLYPKHEIFELCRWLAFAALRETYGDHPECLDEGMALVSENLIHAMKVGVDVGHAGAPKTLRTILCGFKSCGAPGF